MNDNTKETHDKFIFQDHFPNFFMQQVEEEEVMNDSYVPPSDFEYFEEAHVIYLTNTMFEPSNEVISLNPIELNYPFIPLSLLYLKLIN